MKPYEPKKTNRWIVKFPSKFNIREYIIQRINKPKFIDGEWSNFNITIINIVSGSPEPGVYKMINTQPIDGSLFKFTIQDLDPTGEVVGEWEVNVSEVISVDFGDLSFESDEIQKIELVLKAKNCVNKF